MIKLIAIDLDGTLLNSAGKVSEANRQALKLAQEKGAKVVLCTGRPYQYMKHLIDDLGLNQPDDYIITFNGGQIQKAQTGEVVKAYTLSKDDLLVWQAVCRELNLPLNAIDAKEVYEPNEALSTYPSLYLLERPQLASSKQDFASFDSKHLFNKFVISTEVTYLDQQTAKIKEDVTNKYSTFKSNANLFEIVAKGVSKGNIVSVLADYLNIPLSQVMAIGDQENDMSMIEVAGVGVAMGNAIDCVKEVADYVTATQNEDGVAQAINQFV